MNELKNITTEKLQAILEHAKEHPARFIFGLSSTFFILLKVKKIFETENEPPTLLFSLDRDKRVEMIKEYRKNGTLPKVFKAKLFPFSDLFNERVILTDFDQVKSAFGNPTLSNRIEAKKTTFWYNVKKFDSNFDKLAETILGKDDPLVARGFGKQELPAGPYDEHHKLLRKIWLQTPNRLFGKDRIFQIIDESCSRMIKMLNQVNGEGIDPETIFMTSTINVLSRLTIGKIFESEDPEFRLLYKHIENALATLQESYLSQLVISLTPKFLIKKLWFRKFMDNFLNMDGTIFGNDGMYEMYLKEIKRHRQKLDENYPTDFLDVLLIESKTNESIGYLTIILTIRSLYLGGSDTTTNTLRWLVLTLAHFPEVQSKCYEEISESEKHGFLDKNQCPYLLSVLLENMRWHPVAESLLHQASETLIIGDYEIKKGTSVFGSMTSIMMDPAHFPDPEKFIPDRFIQPDGTFFNDPHVCSFSIGLRNCVGKQLAMEEYFHFSAAIIKNFKIKKVYGTFEARSHSTILQPKNFNVQFLPRK